MDMEVRALQNCQNLNHPENSLVLVKIVTKNSVCIILCDNDLQLKDLTISMLFVAVKEFLKNFHQQLIYGIDPLAQMLTCTMNP